jgi:two-component system, response regulator
MRQQEKDDGAVSVEEKKTIPLVEEDEEQVTFAMRALRKHGIVDEVAVAGDGNKAVDYVFGEGGYAGRDTSLAPGFVLLDVDLRGVSGLEVLEKVRSDERTELLPIILFSASTRHGDRSRATSWGPTPTSPNPPASRSSPS